MNYSKKKNKASIERCVTEIIKSQVVHVSQKMATGRQHKCTNYLFVQLIYRAPTNLHICHQTTNKSAIKCHHYFICDQEETKIRGSRRAGVIKNNIINLCGSVS